MKGAKIVSSAEYVGSSGAIRQRVMGTENAVGYVGIAFTEEVKVLEVDGVAASVETVQSKKYGISRELYMYTNGRPKTGSHIANFIGLSKSADGMKLVEDVGFVAVK
jgi:phosphate transport system substrate-binding protein